MLHARRQTPARAITMFSMSTSSSLAIKPNNLAQLFAFPHVSLICCLPVSRLGKGGGVTFLLLLGDSNFWEQPKTKGSNNSQAKTRRQSHHIGAVLKQPEAIV